MIPAWILLCTIAWSLVVIGLLFFLIYRRLPRRLLIREVTSEELEEREKEKQPRWHLELSMNTLEYRGQNFDPVEEILGPTLGGLFSLFLQKGLPIDLEQLQITAEIRLYDGCKYLGQNAIYYDVDAMAQFRERMFKAMEHMGDLSYREIVPGAFAAQRPVAVAAVDDADPDAGLLGIEDLKKLD